VPSILVSRSVGADLLTGRSKQNVTKVTFALAF